MKCPAQKLTKWWRIEKLWRKREIERFSNIKRFALCKSCYLPLTKWLSIRPGWSDFAETGLYGFIITNGEKSRSTNAPNSSEFEELRNFRTMGRINSVYSNYIKPKVIPKGSHQLKRGARKFRNFSNSEKFGVLALLDFSPFVITKP